MLPYGAILHDNGVQFVVFSRSAREMRLLLYDEVEDTEPTEIIPFERETDRWGHLEHFHSGAGTGQLYHFQADGRGKGGQWFDGKARLIDPYAKALAGNFQPSPDGIIRPPKCALVDDY
jgi:glycogen operon protein